MTTRVDLHIIAFVEDEDAEELIAEAKAHATNQTGDPDMIATVQQALVELVEFVDGDSELWRLIPITLDTIHAG